MSTSPTINNHNILSMNNIYTGTANIANAYCGKINACHINDLSSTGFSNCSLSRQELIILAIVIN